ncbi:MAG: hypothetical protein D6B25_09815 [Desulfobulbaceae bacterium]|nr:MAG: hypothetical protein D6B25_09815 [Desulfobulbaceae bacterium]
MIRNFVVFVFALVIHIFAATSAHSNNQSDLIISSFTVRYFSENDGNKPGEGNDGTNKSVVTKEISSETVKRPALMLTFPFHGIDSHNLYAVWEGTIHTTSENRLVNAHFDVSRSDVSFYVNNQLVDKWADDSRTVQFSLEKGENAVRIELHNHWHTTSFNVSFTDYQKLDNASALELFKGIDFNSTKVVYLGAYEAHHHRADNNGNEILVTLPKSSTPIFLFLNSYRAINWVISNPNKAAIAGVVLRGRSKGNTVTTSSPIDVYELPAGSSSYKSSHDIRNFIGRSADYAFTEYSLSNIIVPGFFKEKGSLEDNYPVNAFEELVVVSQGGGAVTKNQVVKEPALSESFSQAQWRGYIEVAEKIDKSFKFSNQNVLAELIIDGRSVWRTKKGTDKIYEHSFEPGRHEVMMVAYPALDQKPSQFAVSITENARELKYDELTNILKEFEDFESVYCGVERSTEADQNVGVIINDSTKPVVLFLTSYRGVIWNFEHAKTDNVLAIVTSAKNSSEAIKNLPAHIPVYNFFQLSNTTDFIPTRGYRGTINRTFKKAALQIFSLTGRLPTGSSLAKQAKTITVPTKVLDREQYLRIGFADVSADYNIFIEYPKKIDMVFNPVPTRYVDHSSTSTPKRTRKLEPEVHRDSWAKPLGATEDIPIGKFRAYYFDMFNPGEPKFSGIVKKVFVETTGESRRDSSGAIVYNLGIIPENFSAFWIGKIKLRKDSEMIIEMDFGHASTRVLIDDKVVKDRKISLKKGIHKIEIEHVNDWHTYDFSFSIARESKFAQVFGAVKDRIRESLPSDRTMERFGRKISELLQRI